MLILCILILVCLLLFLNYKENFQTMETAQKLVAETAVATGASSIVRSAQLKTLQNKRNSQIYNMSSSIHSNGYQLACNELTAKRNFLYMYLKTLLSKQVQDLSSNMVDAYKLKQTNLTYQDIVKTYCAAHINDGTSVATYCKSLASTDGGATGFFAVLPDIDIFYQQLLLNQYNIYSLYAELNYYSAMIGCNQNDINGNPLALNFNDISADQWDANGNLIIMNQIGSIDTQTLALELEKLSPYYLSPDVVKYLIKFLISQEQLSNLNETSAQYLEGQQKLINQIMGFT